jgi:hypothetical protein
LSFLDFTHSDLRYDQSRLRTTVFYHANRDLTVCGLLKGFRSETSNAGKQYVSKEAEASSRSARHKIQPLSYSLGYCYYILNSRFDLFHKRRLAAVKLSRSSSADPLQYLAADYVSDTYQRTLDISATGPLVNEDSFFAASFNLYPVGPFGSSFLFRSSTVRSAPATKHLHMFSIVDARSTTLKILVALVAALDLECDQADVVTAFLNGKLDHDEILYICLPDGRYARLDKALYGLRRSPRLWYEELACFLASIGFDPIEADPCVFVNKTTGAIILAYVDNLLFITRTKPEMAALKALVFDKYKCHDLGPISHYLGIRIRCDRSNRAIELSMVPYINKLAKDYQRGHVTRHNPMDVKALKLRLRRPNDVCED